MEEETVSTKCGDASLGILSTKCGGWTVSVKCGEETSNDIECLQVAQGIVSLRCYYELTSLTMLSSAELGAFPTLTLIIDLEDVELGALCKLMIRVMVVRTS